MFEYYKPKNIWLYEQMFIGRIVVFGTRIFDCLYERECIQRPHFANRDTDNCYLNTYIYCDLTKTPLIYLSHVVIWIYNFGLYPEPYVINHLDGVKANNNISNLELTTSSGNMQHAYDTGLKTVSDKTRELSSARMTGECNILAKLTDDTVRDIRALKLAGASSNELAIRYNVSRRAIENVTNRVSWKHVV